MWTVLRFIVRFFQDLWHAAIFAAIEYDDTLKLTKTPAQRVLIWLIVGGMIILALTVIILLIRQALYSINIVEKIW